MLEIIGALVGFGGSLIAPLFRYIQDKSDKKHELQIMKLQMKLQENNHLQRLEEINIQADIDESKILYKTFYTGIKWIDTLNGTVRPIIAYCFFMLYVCTKVCYVLNTDFFIMEEFWSSTDNTIFLTIIAFFYGQRAMGKIIK